VKAEIHLFINLFHANSDIWAQKILPLPEAWVVSKIFRTFHLAVVPALAQADR
jgi:hypothetical protein